MTRRKAIGAGLALASASAAGAGGLTARGARSIDALLIDATIDMPGPLAAFAQRAGQGLPVIGLHLDAARQDALMRVLARSHAILGISSGATLFCLERMGWDHGFRLIGRRERPADGTRDDAFRRDLAALLAGAPSATAPSPLTRAYRPSRADATLHAWVMQKPAHAQGGPLRQKV